MHRVDTAGNDDGLFQDGSPQIGQQGTILGKDWLNDTQENICNVIEAAGIVLEKGDGDQLKLAIAAMIAAAAASTRVRPGVVEYYAGNAAPTGYLECDGSVKVRADYADLFAVIGTTFNTGGEAGTDFRLPELRGEFIRGWDHGRGLDVGRAFGSLQGHALQDHTHAVATSGTDPDGTNIANASGSTSTNAVTGQVSVGNTAAETRPRNLALLPIIKT